MHTKTRSAHIRTKNLRTRSSRSPSPTTLTRYINLLLASISISNLPYNSKRFNYLYYFSLCIQWSTNNGFQTLALPLTHLQCIRGFDPPQNPCVKLNIIKNIQNGPVSQLVGDPVQTYPVPENRDSSHQVFM